jgi:hypothetical protein
MAEPNPPRPVHVQGTSKGEEVVRRRGREPGRSGRNERAYRTARDATSINPQDAAPIDPRSPSMPPA